MGAVYDDPYIARRTRSVVEKKISEQKRKQPGIGFPSAGKQEHLLVIRLDLSPSSKEKSKNVVRDGLKRLCLLFERIHIGSERIDELLDDGSLKRSPLSEFCFSATIGFGIGFFVRLNIPRCNWPRKLREMPNNSELGDLAVYNLAQTDLIIQLGSSKDFINRWVLENNLQPIIGNDTGEQVRNKNNPQYEEEIACHDIVSATRGWATITDVHAGFQRIDGRNLMGFNDGLSNPKRLSSAFDRVVWTTDKEERKDLTDGTYMVFQKIEHDLEQWRKLRVEDQEKWVGRSKGTGLLLGTLSKDEDRKLSCEMQSNDQNIHNTAIKRWRELMRDQVDPEKRLFDDPNPRYKGITLECPVWSHVRKANPRQADGAENKLIFRRGYPYVEANLNGRINSGLLFICFQRDIVNGFEFIKKSWLNNKAFPVPKQRKEFNKHEMDERHRHARYSSEELRKLTREQRKALGLESDYSLKAAIENAECHPVETSLELEFKKFDYQQYKEKNQTRLANCDTQNTGREGLSGPSKIGINPSGEFIAITPLGGGYYFIPPIPNRSIADIGQQFFEGIGP
jgi:Dyp-type peroxidase family